MVSIALNVLSNYVTDFFKGQVGNHSVSISFVVDKEKKHGDVEDRMYKEVKFKGSPEDLNKLDIKKLKKLVE